MQNDGLLNDSTDWVNWNDWVNASTGSGGGGSASSESGLPGSTSPDSSLTLTPAITATTNEPKTINDERSTMNENSTLFETLSAPIINTAETIKQAAIRKYGVEKVEKTITAAKQAMQTSVKDAVVVATYSVKWVALLLITLFIALNFLIYRSLWMKYTVWEWQGGEGVQVQGETLSDIATRFNMLDYKLRKINHLPIDQDIIPAGTTLTVRNRHFIERDYLDQLQYVLKDFMEKRKWVGV